MRTLTRTAVPTTAPTVGTPGSSLLRRNRDFRLLYTGEVTGQFGGSVTNLALPLIATVVLHADALKVSSLTAAAWLPWLLLGLPAGAWVDRLRRRPVMLAAAACSLLLYLTIPVAGTLGLLTFPQLLAVAFCAGVSAVFFQTAYTALLPTLVAEPDRAEGNAKIQGSASVAQFAGRSSAGAIAQFFGPVNGLFANTVTFLVSVLCTARIHEAERRTAPAARRSLRQDVGEGLRLVLGDSWLRSILAYGGLSNLALTAYQSIQVIFLLNRAGLPQGLIGTLIALSGLGGIAGAAVARRVGAAIGTARALLLFQLGLPVLALLIPLADKGAGAACYLVGGLAVSGGVVAGNVLRATFIQRYVPAEMFGRTSATTAVVVYGTMPIGALLGGGLAQAFGLGTAMWLSCAAVPLAATVLLCSPIRRHRDLPNRPMTAAPTA
ncbi:MFS transporter [Kitasatospora acidiphila]|uniref:MFS transporter n=1 Tax=Kitasatospora acidiphila TaxID=2567942 RepID=A0A540W918_9ACTN|nr:MFS transporter [Kitasatospora acidiphila]TQF05511.1 MFS transporter [Kitasatospora acidiphila]